jgi:hypothetical protein
LVVLVKEDRRQQVYVPIRAICDYLGIAWSAQRNRVNRDPELSEVITVMIVTITTAGATETQTREMLCLPLDYLNGGFSALTQLGLRKTSVTTWSGTSVSAIVFWLIVPSWIEKYSRSISLQGWTNTLPGKLPCPLSPLVMDLGDYFFNQVHTGGLWQGLPRFGATCLSRQEGQLDGQRLAVATRALHTDTTGHRRLRRIPDERSWFYTRTVLLETGYHLLKNLSDFSTSVL